MLPELERQEWLLLRREMLHQQALAALHTLVQGYEHLGDEMQAHVYASRQLALDPSHHAIRQCDGGWPLWAGL